MRGFLSHMQRRGVGKRSIARTLSAIRTFYRYLANANDIDANPAKMVGTPKSERYLPSYLDRAQIELLFQLAEARAMEGGFVDVRNLAILELFYSTGMRLSELQGLDRSDLDLVSQQVKVLGKGRKQRIVPVGDHSNKNRGKIDKRTLAQHKDRPGDGADCGHRHAINKCLERGVLPIFLEIWSW